MEQKKNQKDVLIVRDEKTGEISVVAGLKKDGTPKTTAASGTGKSSVRCPLKPKRFYPLKIFNNAPSKSLDRWGYYYFSLFPSVYRHLPDTFSG